MKITILSDNFPPNGLGGAEVVACNLAHGLANNDHEVSVITTTKHKNEVGTFIEGKLVINRVYSNYNVRWRAYLSLYNIKVVRNLDEILKNINPDVVHIHNVHEHLSYASIKIAKKYSKAVFLTFHDVMSVHYGKLGAQVDSRGNILINSTNPFTQLRQYKFYYNPIRNFVIKYYLNYVDKMFSVSRALKDVLEKKGIKPIEVLHNGINVSNWGIDEEKLISFKKKYRLEGKKVFFFGGRISSIKGGIVAIEVLKKISLEFENVVLLIVGNKNEFSEKMLVMAGTLGIKDKVVFTGWIPNHEMNYVYNASDIVLVLSQYLDPFPTVNLEAMASKKPLIGTIFGGTREVVLDEVTGYIVDPRDIKKIADKISILLLDEEKAKDFGLRGYSRVSTDFSDQVWVKKTLSWYAEILKNN